MLYSDFEFMELLDMNRGQLVLFRKTLKEKNVLLSRQKLSDLEKDIFLYSKQYKIDNNVSWKDAFDIGINKFHNIENNENIETSYLNDPTLIMLEIQKILSEQKILNQKLDYLFSLLNKQNLN